MEIKKKEWNGDGRKEGEDEKWKKRSKKNNEKRRARRKGFSMEYLGNG